MHAAGAMALALGTALAGAGGLCAPAQPVPARAPVLPGRHLPLPACSAHRHGVAIPAWRSPRMIPTVNLYVTAAHGSDTSNTCLVEGAPCKTLGRAISGRRTRRQSCSDRALTRRGQTRDTSPNVVPPHVDDSHNLSTEHNSTGLITAAGFTTGITINSSKVGIAGLSVERARREGIYVFPSTEATAASRSPTSPSPTAGSSTTTCAPPSNGGLDHSGAVHHSHTGERLRGGPPSPKRGRRHRGDKRGLGQLRRDPGHRRERAELDNHNRRQHSGDKRRRLRITLAGHNPTAVHTSGPTTGKPDPSSAGVYRVTVAGNQASNNGAAGIIDAGGPPGAGVYDNVFSNNEAVGDGLAGFSIHSHAPLQDMNGNASPTTVSSTTRCSRARWRSGRHRRAAAVGGHDAVGGHPGLAPSSRSPAR